MAERDDRGRYTLDDLEIDLTSGEVRHPDGTVERLAPQPASLLALLMEHAGAVVDRERIREHIWGDVAVDFESSLHYCVRQVRAALGDSAAEARFVETLARRGYRLKVQPAELAADAPDFEVDSDPQARTERSTPISAPVSTSAALSTSAPLSTSAARAAVGTLAVLLLGLFGLALSGAPSVVQRVAVLPFEPPADWADETRTESVAELLLLHLGQDPSSLVVLGPTSTTGHGADGADLGVLAADLEVQWAINGRYIEAGNLLPGDGRGVLVELIRARDGAHVWVEAYPLSADPGTVADEVAAAVAGRLAR